MPEEEVDAATAAAAAVAATAGLTKALPRCRYWAINAGVGAIICGVVCAFTQRVLQGGRWSKIKDQ